MGTSPKRRWDFVTALVEAGRSPQVLAGRYGLSSKDVTPAQVVAVFAKTQVGFCDTAGFLGIIFKIRLCVLVCMVTDDFDGVFVCANPYCSLRSSSWRISSLLRTLWAI